MKNPTTTTAWKKLSEHCNELKDSSIQQFFAEDKQRAEKFHIEWNAFLVDYSKHKITEKTCALLTELANEMELSKAIQEYYNGGKLNKTENRAVLHTALRAPETAEIFADGKNVIPEVYEVRAKMKSFVEKVTTGSFLGYTGKKITDIVNIGIGGSDLGVAMAVEALQFYKNHLNTHFVSNIDGDHIQEILKKLNPETTLFVVVSKTFTTQETLTNAQTARKWLLESAELQDIGKHFVAVSTNVQKAEEFGIASLNIFPMWDWVGGRFSLWSAVGLSVGLSIGYDNFEKMLLGAQKMDEHFKNESFEKNIPVVLALLSVWYNNFFGAETETVIPYSQYLQKLAPYLQQAIMESNGKSIDQNGNRVNYQTGTIVWGETGTNAQHAFFQLIHQGTKLIPADFIGFAQPLYGNIEHHNKLMANFFAQTEALLMGKNEKQVLQEFEKQNITQEEAQFLLPFKIFDGNKPTTTILIEKLTPETFGSLIALYEHKIFVQGIIWNIFSYDQWGVELGKQLANTILNEIETKKTAPHDSSTAFLLKKFTDYSK